MALWWHLTYCFWLQVSSSFLKNLLGVIKDTLEITQGGGPTLLELLGKASVTHMWTQIVTSDCKKSTDKMIKTKDETQKWALEF